MAGFAQGSRTSLRYVEEVDFGTTPATPTMIDLPFTTHNLSLGKERVQGNDIQSDRMPRHDRHGNRNVSGDLVVDLRKGDYDPFLESAMFNGFAADTLKVGTTPRFMTIEDAAEDIGQYRLFSGCGVSTMSMSVRPNQMVTTTFTVMGKDMVQGTATTAASVTPASLNSPFDAYSGTVQIGDTGGVGVANTTLTGIDLTLTNGFNPTFVVGSDSAPCLEFGRAEVSGTATFYYEDAAILDRFLDEVETELEFSIDDNTGANPYTFLIPRAKFNSGDVPVDNPQSRIVTVSFIGLFDTAEQTNLRIDRTA